MALSTLASVKTYLNISGTSDDGRLTAILNGVSARIERITQRTYAATDYVERANIFRTESRYQLRQTPVIQVRGLHWGKANAIQLSYSGAAVTASVQTTPTACICRTVSVAGVVTTSTLAFADYPTGELLAAAINALGGFTAVVQAAGVESKYIFPTAGLQLKIGNATATLALAWPNVNFFEYSVDYTFGTLAFSPWSSTNYFFASDRPPEAIRFPEAYQMLTIDYRAGYETIPDDIDLLCQELTALQYSRSLHDPSLQSESLKDYSYSLIDGVKTDEIIRSRLAEYCRIPVAGGMG